MSAGNMVHLDTEGVAVALASLAALVPVMEHVRDNGWTVGVHTSGHVTLRRAFTSTVYVYDVRTSTLARFRDGVKVAEGRKNLDRWLLASTGHQRLKAVS
jgi:predicted dithiol-disulfide oxidoreductase (DUF899 family)